MICIRARCAYVLSAMHPMITENDKKPGISYAFTDDGLELPVLDITHPAFAVRISDDDMNKRVERFRKIVRDQDKIPYVLRRIIFGALARKSVLLRSLHGAAGTYLGGLHTYMIKLGPDNLNDRFFGALDRNVSEAGGLFMRQRFQDIVTLLADALVAPLAARRRGPLQLLSIGGGPAVDCMNVLMMLRASHPELLEGRCLCITTLDLDSAGPGFGRRALAALQEQGGALAGLTIEFRHVRYDWSQAKQLQSLFASMDSQSIVAVSSEGGLFEYGSDADVSGSLAQLHALMPADGLVAGSVTRADDLGREMNRAGQKDAPALSFRGITGFEELASRAGWELATSIDRPMCHDVLLRKRQ